MARTLILNVSATTQTLPAGYGGGEVASGFGWVVSDESSLVVAALGGFADMDGKWAVSAISTDTALGSIDVAAGGVALLAEYAGSGNGSGGPVTWGAITGKPTFSSVATSGSYTDLINKPALSDVATSGDYDDLTNTPAIPTPSNATPNATSATGAAGVGATYARGDHQHAHGSLAGGGLHSAATTIAAGFMSASDKSKLDGLATVASTGAYADLSGTPALADVAISGSYNDLTDTPAQFSGAYADLTGKPSLSDVALSGDYADLTGTPALAPVATSGAYADLTGKPALFDGAYASLTGKPSLAPVATSGAYGDLSGTPSLAPVATSGAYADLSGKPALAAVATSGSAADLTNNPYDIIADATGALTVGMVIRRIIAPRNLVLSTLAQGSTTTATVELQVAGVAASYPQAVTAGQLITVVVTTAGTDCWFSVTGKVA